MKFDALIEKYGYPRQLAVFLSKVGLDWQETLVVKAIEQKLPERDIIELALTPPNLDAVAVDISGVDVDSQFQSLMAGASIRGKQEYLKYSTPDGSFRYSDYFDELRLMEQLLSESN